MEVIYQLTFFLALGLLAIVISVFVFAVSLLGRAMEAAVRSENKKLAERKNNNAKEMASIKKEIEEAEASGQIPTGLTRKLKKLEKMDKKFDKELSKIRRAPKLLTVKGGIIPPGIALLVAIILSGVAWYLWYLYTIGILILIEPVFIWIVSLIAILYGIFRIYRSLNVIESVAITSEEAALKKTVEAFKIAQQELEEEKKPQLVLKFRGKEFPLYVKADSEVELPLALRIYKGDFAEDVSVHIAAPAGFSFPGESTSTMPADSDYPKYIDMKWEAGKIIKGLRLDRTITMKTPKTAGNYSIVYFIVCKGFWVQSTELDVIVE